MKKTAFSVSKWGYTDKGKYYSKNDDTRALRTVGIGEDENGLVEEVIYADVAEKIVNKEYKITFDMYCYPILVVTNGNTIIYHNPEIKQFTDNVKMYLNQINWSALIEVIEESRVNTNGKIGPNIKKIWDYLYKTTNIKFNTSYLIYVIKELYKENEHRRMNVVQSNIHSLNNDSLYELYTEILQFCASGKAGKKHLEKYIKMDKAENISNYVVNEISLRFFTMDIK